ncbi:Dehydrogenase/reductase SDR family member on chromosome X [Seminavis robusta]|uniref:Dehydrogenase/reductase SDR family member on chromosome X n=1 Tax=Seminavis robusta TaxID=568900 RepID=A0A9N8EBG0_9STRA|nr:Dehydrogenase/reductase SDR family member on chromosome X [Seminavis robusta]|eukprot:Sro923_g220710.1 Dehydrogenase/reductase SDR family member on chromosome X (335) ;mRNA; r:18528-19532
MANTATSTSSSTNPYNLPDLSGKTAIITGGNSGLGLKTALELVRQGAAVVITCRSANKGEEAVADVKQELPRADIAYGVCDLCDLASVKYFVDNYQKDHANSADNKNHLDIVVANAGVSTFIQEGQPGKHQLTKDDQDFFMQANYLGHFALIHGLMPLLLKSEAPRVVSCNTFFSNTENYANAVDLPDFNWSQRAAKGEYNVKQAYFASRLAQQQMTVKLNQEFQKNLGPDTKAVAAVLEPGLVQRAEPDKSALLQFFRQPVDVGCRTHLVAATDPNVKPNDFLEPHRFNLFGFLLFGPPTTYTLNGSKKAADQVAVVGLWDLSKKIVQKAWSS